jgi:hypothetical protein
MTKINNMGGTGMRAEPAARRRSGTQSGQEIREEPIRIASGDGLELIFKSARGDRHFDSALNNEIELVARRLARSCAGKQDFPAITSLFTLARKTQYRTAARREFEARAMGRRRKFADAAAAIACVLLFYAVLAGAERRLGEQRHLAVIALESISVDSPKSGYLVFALPSGPVHKGDAVAGVRTPGGGEFVLEAPCDCQLASTSVRPGGRVLSGKPLLKFWQEGTREFVSLRVTMAEALRLKSGVTVNIASLTSGARHQFKAGAEAVSIQSLPSGTGSKPMGDVAVRIYASNPLHMPAGDIVTARLQSSLLGGAPSTAQAGEEY